MTTEDRFAGVVDEAADQAAEQTRDHKGPWWIAAGFGLLLAGVVWLSWHTVHQSAEISHLDERQRTAADAAHQLADQVRSLGGTPAVQPPAVGEQGETGPAGRGIASTSIVAGRLLIAYSDGSTEDKGAVVGAAGPVGAPGVDGAPGRGVVGTAILAGRLILSYSDQTTEDVGQVVGTTGADGDDGAPGRGVTSVAALDDRLIVTYTDGTSTDAGPLPAGLAGRGVQHTAVIDCRWRVTYTDGTTEDAGVACTTQTVTPPPSTTASTPTPPLRPLGR
ncbi:hypothetical protein [Actinosynnema sp. NPDC023587]|uniref:hypothetical protein n=1 Tax=Actinosynnema sp. NPDC023587 TaxID=3154695 RepID=UPI0033F669D9